jgi:hypothetical protein
MQSRVVVPMSVVVAAVAGEEEEEETKGLWSTAVTSLPSTNEGEAGMTGEVVGPILYCTVEHRR